jgi:hypothetical protein
MSFFQWLREGVRQAVVLGVADAVEDVGTRVREDDLGPALAQSLRDRLTVRSEPTVLQHHAAAGTPAGKRRLGRSLESLRDKAA